MISREKLVQLYAAMLKSRMLAERTAKLAQEGRLPHNWEVVAGSEATLAGVAADLRPDDALSAPGHWLLGSLIDGISLENALGPAARRSGKVSASGNGNSSNTPDWQGIDFNAATQAARAYKAAKDGRIALIFCKDSPTSDVSSKRLEFVGRHSLPMILLHHLDTRDRRESSPSPRQSRDGSVGALAFGVPRIAVDARDVLAVYRVASESIARARQRRGPTLIECLDHGLPAGSGGKADRGQSAVADPLRAMASYLGKKRILTASLKQEIKSQFCREIDAAMKLLIN